MPGHNEWTTKFGARRQALDKKLLVECEAKIETQEKTARSIPDAVNPVTRSTTASDREDARKRIALAFGRPAT